MMVAAMAVALALIAFWLNSGLPVGTARSMGAGYLPMACATLLLLLGLVIGVRGALLVGGRPVEPWSLRPLLFIFVTICTFALLVEPLGIVLTVSLVTVISALASEDHRWREIIPSAIFAGIATWAIFIAGLGLALPVWPKLLG